MKLSYQLATISYCLLAVGKTANAEGLWSAAMVGVDAKRMGIDPLSSAMLADVPHMIRRHVDGAMRRVTADATPQEVLRAFHESLKTSIHVSEIRAAQEVEVPDPRHLARALMDSSFAALEASLKELAAVLPRRGQWTPRVAPARLMTPAPEQMFWQPASPDRAAAVA